MKIIKPQDLPFTSNIPEPDPNQGEALYVGSGKTLKAVSGTGQLKSAAFVSDNGYAFSSTKDWKLKTYSLKGLDFSEKSSGMITNQIESITTNFGEIVHDTASGGRYVIVCCSGAGTGNLYVSSDGGSTFAVVSVGASSGSTPTGVVYVGGSQFICNASHSVMRSTNGGVSWSEVSSDGAGEFSSTSNTSLVFNENRVVLFSNTAIKVSSSVFTSFTLSLSDRNITSRLSSGASGLTYFCESFFGYTISKSDDNGASKSVTKDLSLQPLGLLATSNKVFVSFAVTELMRVYEPDLSSYQSVNHNLGSGTTAFWFVESGGAVFAFGFNGAVSVSINGFNDFKKIDGVSFVIGGACASDASIFISGTTRGGALVSGRLPIGDHAICNETNETDSTSVSTCSIVNGDYDSGSYALVNKYAGMFQTRTLSKNVLLSASKFTNPTYGQCCADSRYIYQLVKNGNWFVYKLDTTTGTSTNLDLGASYTTNIDDTNSNPFIFLINDELNIPINKSAPNGFFDTVLKLSKAPATTVEITPNQRLESKALAGMTDSEQMVWILDDNKAEITDITNFDQLGGYRVGDEVISQSTHRRYRAATSTIDTPEIGSRKSPPTWVDIGPTNKYAFRDIYIHNRTISQSDGTTEGDKVRFNLNFNGSSDSISFFGLQNTDEIVIYYYGGSNSDIIETRVISLIDYEATLKTGEQTLLESFVVIGDNFNENAVSARIELRPDDSGNAVAVGRMITGKAVELGVTQYGAKLSIEDFSRRERDEFGNFNIIPRDTAKNIDFDVKIPKENVNFVFTYLSKLTTIPCVFLGDDEDAAVQVYGYYSDYTHNIDYPSITSATISVEGLT